MKIKTSMRYHLISECPSLKSLQIISAGEGVEKNQPSCSSVSYQIWLDCHCFYPSEKEFVIKKEESALPVSCSYVCIICPIFIFMLILPYHKFILAYLIYSTQNYIILQSSYECTKKLVYIKLVHYNVY